MRNSLPLRIILVVLLGALVVLFGLNFIFSSTMSKETAIKLLPGTDESTNPDSLRLFLPKDDPATSEKLAAGTPVLHFLLVNDNQIFVYRNVLEKGEWTSYQNVGSLLQKESDEKHDLVVIISPSPKASYKNTVDMLDQMSINKIKKFVLTEPKKDEMRFIERIQNDDN
jgi:hypothetical protein